MKIQELMDKAFEKSGGQIIGDILVVEHLPDEEVRTQAGLILASGQRQVGAFDADRPHFVRVLAVGPGYYNEETKEEIPLEYEKGNVLLLPTTAVKYFTSFGSYIGKQLKHKKGETFGVGIAKAGEEWFKFPNEESYRTYMSFFGPESNHE